MHHNQRHNNLHHYFFDNSILISKQSQITLRTRCALPSPPSRPIWNDPFFQWTRYNAWTPKTAPSPWNFVTLPEEDRAMGIGNKHAQKIWWRSRVWFRRYPVGQTDTQTDTLITILRSALAGEVTRNRRKHRNKTKTLKCARQLDVNRWLAEECQIVNIFECARFVWYTVKWRQSNVCSKYDLYLMVKICRIIRIKLNQLV